MALSSSENVGQHAVRHEALKLEGWRVCYGIWLHFICQPFANYPSSLDDKDEFLALRCEAG